MCASSIPRVQARTSWEERGAMTAASAGSLPEGEMSQYETGGFALVSQHRLRRSALCQGRLCPLPEVSGSRQQDNELIRIIAII